MKILNNSQAPQDLQTLIEDKVYSYYPELMSEHIDIEGTCLKKCHQSIIYQFDIHNTKDVLKSVIVKKRVYNKFYNNHIIENTEKEFDVLQYLNNIPGSGISAPRVLDVIPEEGILITEKVKGESLYSYLKRTSYLPITKSRMALTKQIFAKTGEWLRDFHDASSKGKREKINTREFVKKANLIVAKFPLMGLPINLANAVSAKIEKMEKDVANYVSPVALKHGDFQPLNIIVQEDKVTILDINAKNRDIAIKDVCNFIIGMTTFNIKSLYSFWNSAVSAKLVESFLKAYFKDEVVPYPAIEFVSLLGVLESLENTYKRNKSFIKKRRAVSFYKRKIENLII